MSEIRSVLQPFSTAIKNMLFWIFKTIPILTTVFSASLKPLGENEKGMFEVVAGRKGNYLASDAPAV